MSAVTFAFIVVYKFNILAFIMCFMWGFQDSAVNTHAQEILGFEFDDNYTPFSLYGIIQSLSCFIFQLVVSGVNTKDQFFNYTIFTSITAFICMGATYFFPFSVKSYSERKGEHNNVHLLDNDGESTILDDSSGDTNSSLNKIN
jgi:hypothetical protein